ncbi:tenascin-N isoform X2 [Fundulus heteroclitus]|uniref:tenascin-N isoform X2 n=1 Tax=Fundulus heteroclitus TaxID=8078 RepID=UPI00165AB71D|nr:tenascin-N isoform X2 [Fundulus heteroclitus]
MSTGLLWRALCLLTTLCTVSHHVRCIENQTDPSGTEQGLTFSHVYKIDIPGSSSCTVERLPARETGLQQDTAINGENDIVFKHNIKLQTPKCNCEESESFKDLLYRINGLEEEVTYLKTQCTQGCCGRGGAAGVDTSCSGHGSYQDDTCSCLCNPGWEGPDCSLSSCPDECSDNGRCVDGKCVCYEGYTGEDCSQQTCPGDCNDKGQCVDGKCVCYEGYTGEDCSQQTCPGDCNDKGQCVDGKCVCFEGYTGEDCSQQTCPGDCNDKGQCVDGKCVCFPHFTGEDCSIPKCPNDCQNGQCVDGQCICEEGFYGVDCSLVLAPQGLRLVEVTDVTLLVEWDSVQGAEYYVLTYHPKFDEGAMKQAQIPNSENSYFITGLTPGVTYIVQVRAVIKNIQSEADMIEATTDVSTIDDIQVTGQTEDSIQVDWKNPQAEVDYFRLKHTDPSGQEEELNVQMSQEARTKHTIVGLYPGTEYKISVQSIKGNTEGKASFTTGVTDIDAPTNLVTTEVTEDTATVSWDKVQAEIEGYMLRYTSSESSSSDIFVGRDSTSYRLVGLRPGVLHTVYIWAFRGDKVSGKSSTEAETELDAPANLLARDETESSFTVSWEPVQADVDGYMLTYSSSESFEEEIPIRSSATSHMLTKLRPGVLYTVYVWAVKGDKVTRKISTVAETEIDSPKDLKASDVTLDSASLTWVPPLADIEGYILTYRDEDGNLQAVERRLEASKTSFAASNLEIGKKYIVTIIAFRGSKRSKVVETTFKTVGAQHPFPMDCEQVMKNGNKNNGLYTVYINNDRSKPIEVYCDMTTDGGGWLVLQRRNTGQLDFMKRWRQYIAGFGNLTEEFWLGLDKIYAITNTPTQYELRFDLGLGSERAYAVYDSFKIAPIRQKFKLAIGKYRGTAGDAMTYHQGRPWTTIDSDNDIALTNCAMTHSGAWWYKNCHLANLNGKWGDNRHSLGVNWEPWKGHLTSLDFTEMKIRPVGVVSSRKKRSLMARERKSRASNGHKK